MPYVVEQRLEHVAFHEAGHAVAAWALDRRFRYVSIIPDKGSDEHCQQFGLPPNFRPDVRLTRTGRFMLEHRIITSLAGATAAELFGASDVWLDADADLRSAYYMARPVIGESQDETDAYIGWLKVRTRNLLNQPSHRRLVQALAAELMTCGSLRYRAAMAVIREDLQLQFELNEQQRLGRAAAAGM